MRASYRVFIAHGGADTIVADRIFRAGIEGRGAAAFLDSAATALGDEFRRLVFAEIAAAQELLVLLTPSSIRRPWIFAEIGAMMALRKRIVAINYGVDEEVLDRLGIKTLLGPHLMGTLNDVDRYFGELSSRIGRADDA